MGASIDIYGIPQKIDYYSARIRDDPDICDVNKADILKFFDYCYATGLSKVRVLFYAMRSTLKIHR